MQHTQHINGGQADAIIEIKNRTASNPQRECNVHIALIHFMPLDDCGFREPVEIVVGVGKGNKTSC